MRFHRIFRGLRIPVLCFLAAIGVSLLSPGTSPRAQQRAEKSLYHRMGGYDVIAAVVDDFLVRLRDDPKFTRFGGGRAKSSLMRARQLIVDQICSFTGGPCVYIGRDMKASHEGLKITPAEWEAAGKYLAASLDKLKVAEKEKGELLAMVEKLRDDIVEEKDKK